MAAGMGLREDALRRWTACFAMLAFIVAGDGAVRVRGQSNVSASTLVTEFHTTSVFYEQLEVGKKIVALHDKSVLAPLEISLASDDRHERANAAYVFGGLGDERGIKTLRRILEDRTSNRSEGQGSADFGRWTAQGQIKGDRYYAVHVLGVLKDARAVPILIPFLRDKDVNYKVAWSLGEIGDTRAVAALVECLSDASPDMRVAAIEALGTLKAKQALPRLRLMMGDPETIHTGNLESVGDAAKSTIAGLEAIP